MRSEGNVCVERNKNICVVLEDVSKEGGMNEDKEVQMKE